jgi:DNA-binding GntR family transcriptional regulator
LYWFGHGNEPKEAGSDSDADGVEQTMRAVRHVAPLRQEVVRLLRQDILDQELQPGERLTESSLCERYDVSRTVIREVLRQLETENLITMRPHRGPIVTVLSSREICSIYEVRRELEGLAGELFALRASDEVADALLRHIAVMEKDLPAGDLGRRVQLKEEFYRLLLQGADNPILDAMLAGVHARIGIFRHYAFQHDRRVQISLEELRRIALAAAEDRDPEAARRACEDHIRHAGELAIEEYRRRVPEPAESN